MASSSSRFVSGGTNEEPTERDEAWLKAQATLDAKHVAAQQAKHQDGGISLYETLQANKAAKQEAFEESIRLKNQFQTLNEDEIEFLDSVLEQQRNAEAQVKRETREQMELFRKQQDEAERQGEEAPRLSPAGEQRKESWSVTGRKRKAAKERGAIAGVKLRRTSSTTLDGERSVTQSSPTTTEQVTDTAPKNEKIKELEAKVEEKAPAPSLGLAAYSSDED